MEPWTVQRSRKKKKNQNWYQGISNPHIHPKQNLPFQKSKGSFLQMEIWDVLGPNIWELLQVQSTWPGDGVNKSSNMLSSSASADFWLKSSARWWLQPFRSGNAAGFLSLSPDFHARHKHRGLCFTPSQVGELGDCLGGGGGRALLEVLEGKSHSLLKGNVQLQRWTEEYVGLRMEEVWLAKPLQSQPNLKSHPFRLTVLSMLSQSPKIRRIFGLYRHKLCISQWLLLFGETKKKELINT